MVLLVSCRIGMIDIDERACGPLEESMSSITFVTDQRPGEPDLLSGHQLEALTIMDLDRSKVLLRILPSGPWTHEALVETGDGIAQMLPQEIENGVEAFLGSQWVGGTEV